MRGLTCCSFALLVAFATADLGAQSRSGGDSLPTSLKRFSNRPSDTLKVIPAALTIEGGGSLGSYEAGLTWALVETYRQVRQVRVAPESHTAGSRAALLLLSPLDLRAVAGASAGTINALLAGLLWCSAEDVQIPEQSIFWKSWIPVGVGQLLPENPAQVEARSVLQRGVFRDEIFPFVEGQMRGKSRRDCSVGLGAIATAYRPDSVRVTSDRYVRDQRYVFALQLRTDTVGKLRVFGPPSKLDAFRDLGRVATLPIGKQGLPVDSTKMLFDLLLGSSAYPLAFAPMRFPVCVSSGDSTFTCNGQLVEFLDGGVFDNGPILPTFRLLDAATARDNSPRAMLFISPGSPNGGTQRRDIWADRKPLAKPGGVASGGFLDVRALISNFVPSARQYELQLTRRLLEPHMNSARDELAYRARLQDWRSRATELLDRARVDSQLLDTTRKAAVALHSILGSDRVTLDSVRLVLDACAGDASKCADTTFRAELTRLVGKISNRALGSVPIANSLPLPALPTSEGPVAERATLEDVVRVSRRWHPLAGDWLFGFGAFLGRPFREYDFYVGIYDALKVLAREDLCGTQADSLRSACANDGLKGLLEALPFPVSDRGHRLLLQLYEVETGTSLSGLADDRDALSSLARAMGSRMRAPGERLALADTAGCAGGSIAYAFACREGVMDVIGRLRADLSGTGAVDSARKRSDSSSLGLEDNDFRRLFADPKVELETLFARAVRRIDEATPRQTGSKTVAIALHAAVRFNVSRATKGWDLGASSMPDQSNGWPLKFLPNSMLFIPAGITSGEWTVRSHLKVNKSTLSTKLGRRYVDVTSEFGARVLRRSFVKLIAPSGALDTTQSRSGSVISVPIARWSTLLYWGGSTNIAYPGLSSAGFRLGWSTRSEGGGAGSFVPGLTATTLSGKIRTNVDWMPSVIGGRREFTVSAGISDVPGMLYWITRLSIRR